jgi:uncharacterized protein YbjQ (UPF0145 family)
MLIVTTETVAGREIAEVIGEVIGVTARTANPYTEGIRSADGSSNPVREPALLHWRQEAVAAMVATAASRGANAIVGMRFDNRRVSDTCSEICAYGTAVRLSA